MHLSQLRGHRLSDAVKSWGRPRGEISSYNGRGRDSAGEAEDEQALHVEQANQPELRLPRDPSHITEISESQLSEKSESSEGKRELLDE